MALVLATAPASEPITLAEGKLHLRVDHTADDSLITALITVARERVEDITRRALISQTWDLKLDAWPVLSELRIPLPPLLSVTSVKYLDKDGIESTMPSTDYIVDTASEPGRIVLAWAKSWPETTTLYPVNPITVRFVAGYGAAGSDVPQAIRQAMLLMIGEWYENRENAGEARLQQISLSAEALLWPYRRELVR